MRDMAGLKAMSRHSFLRIKFKIVMVDFLQNNKNAIYGGILASVFTGLGVFLLGNVSAYGAKNLLKVSLFGVNILCNTIVLASATILALLLTVLSISSGS